MAPANSSKRDVRREEHQEDIRNLLEKICDYDPDENFYKTFSREANKGIQHIIDRSKEKLRDLKWREDNGDLSKIMISEAGKIRSLKNYIVYLKIKGDSPSEASKLRHKTITLDD